MMGSVLFGILWRICDYVQNQKNARIQFKQISTYIELLRQSTLKKIFGNLDQETIEYSIFIIKKILLFYFIPKKISKNTKARN